MKSMMLTGIRQMEMAERREPAISRPDDVMLVIDTVGVCGSDIHYYATGRIGSQVVHFPFPVGHECSARVLEVGPAVRELKPGDRVAVDPAISCGECDQCRANRRHTCRNLLFMGCPGQIDGCLCERYVMPAESLYRIPDAMSMEQAALVEPLSIGLYAVKLSIPMRGARIGILGAGPIGLSVMTAARYLGADTVYLTEPVASRRELAAEHGADLALDPSEGNDPILAREPGLLDVVFECSGEQAAVDQGLALLKPGGKFMIIGIPEVDRISFEADTMRRREICVQNVRRQNECMQGAIDMVMHPDVDVDFMITHRMTLNESKAAFDMVDQKADGVVKVMLRIDG